MTQTERGEVSSLEEPQEPQGPKEALERERLDGAVSAQKAAFLSRFHHAMVILGLSVTLIMRLRGWEVDLAALWSAHALMWINLILLARGLEGLLTRQRAVAGLIVVQLMVPLLGAWLLITLFPDAMGALLIGASLWVAALLYASVERISA